ncbi:2430_t:CDS:2 [Paraglomus brasilianum]|uniref:2430_t:CDS:1 n=1 Tax=Paraglomus brasilianum TaxID=144538 RepID=A0A9N9FG01_9GLOM|nr:2430_t:CDS:2 [Paraglomus brasilianum]
MTQLQVILDRLAAENLNGPLTPTSPSGGGYPPRTLRRASYDAQSPYQEEAQETDSLDPKWLVLFQEFFLENSDSKHDDLLFFVRQMHSENEHLDPVFVKRKAQPHVMPQLDDAVMWKETFFLNLIVQLPCKLTVAVCTRTALPDNSQKTSMTCSHRHVSTRVYALPTKSRMDIKDTSMECSYPLIYYVVDDYEEMFEQLIVREDDYRPMANGPFPPQVPSTDTKITLFQGAAPFSALLDIYKQKASGKLNKRFKMGPVTPPTEYVMMRGPNSKGHAQVAITAAPIENTQQTIDITSPSTFAPNSTSEPYNHVNGTNSSSSAMKLSGSGNGFKYDDQTSPQLRPTSSTPATIFQSLKKLSQLAISDRPAPEPESLRCCMTFINVPWTSVVSDLISPSRKKISS